MVAEFESDLIRMRTREGMKIAKANGRLRGKQPKLKPNQAKHLLELHDLGTYPPADMEVRQEWARTSPDSLAFPGTARSPASAPQVASRSPAPAAPPGPRHARVPKS